MTKLREQYRTKGHGFDVRTTFVLDLMVWETCIFYDGTSEVVERSDAGEVNAWMQHERWSEECELNHWHLNR